LNYIKYQLYISWIYRSTTVEGIDVVAGYVVLLLSSKLSDSFSRAEAIIHYSYKLLTAECINIGMPDKWRERLLIITKLNLLFQASDSTY
jgi:hypothetical protein